MERWLYKWLPIIFGCHCRADRSFFYKGKQFPICARCTGELVGILLVVLLGWIWTPPVWVSIVLLTPMLIDGFAQSLTKYESKNHRRFLTGLLFGIGLSVLVGRYFSWLYRAGYRKGLELFGK